MFRHFVLFTMILASAFTHAQQNQALSLIEQASLAAIAQGQAPEQALADALKKDPENAEKLVSFFISNTDLSAALAVSSAISVLPEQTSVIVASAIQVRPNNIQEIVSSAIAVSSDENIIKVVISAVQAAPQSSQSIITAAVIAQPDMVEDIVVSVAEQVIIMSEQAESEDSLLALLNEDELNSSYARGFNQFTPSAAINTRSGYTPFTSAATESSVGSNTSANTVVNNAVAPASPPTYDSSAVFDRTAAVVPRSRTLDRGAPPPLSPPAGASPN
jgi:hypothetical protein